MTAKQQAIRDIKESLRSERKSFLAFHKELNPVMDYLVNEHIQQQQKH